MKRVAVIGFDGFDAQVAREMLPDLPNLRAAADEGQFFELRSVFPPDSVSAWTTIYTGLPPHKHGVIDSIDYLDARRTDLDTTLLRGRTFWDVASQAGKRVCIVNPFMAYPAWPVNGVMVSGPVFEGGEASVYPDDIASKYKLPPLGGFVDFPKRAELGDFAARTRDLTTGLADFGLRLARDVEWDLFFICFLTIDRIQHFFWRYWDKDDPTHPGPSSHASVIPDFYKLYDEILGRFVHAVGNDAAVLMISDHGHGMRCTKGVYMNELLRQKGYLRSRASKLGPLDPKVLVERTKNAVLQAAYRYDLEDWIYRVARIIPRAKALKKSTYIISESESIARVPLHVGNNPFGGIDINKEAAARAGLDYETVRDDLISALRDLKDPADGLAVAQWVIRREELPDSEARDKFPDIVYQLRPDYGTQRAMYTSILGTNPFHRKISGGHRAGGVLAASGVHLAGEGAALTDLRPTILSLLGVQVENSPDGRSLAQDS